MIFILLILTSVAAPLSARESLRNAPLYESVEDPNAKAPLAVLVVDDVLGFGRLGEQRSSLARSDLGFPLYFVRVDGGVRVRGQPIVFPAGSRKHFDFEDYSCSVLPSGARDDVLCRSKTDGELYRSQITRGGLVSFEIKCFNQIGRVCHFQLKSGRPIRPTKVQPINSD